MPTSLTIPAFTAYCEPDPDAIRFSERDGATGWRDPEQRLVWFGKLSGGAVQISVALRLPERQSARFRMTIGRTRRDGILKPTDTDGLWLVDFGQVTVQAGYVRFALEGLSRSGETFGQIDALRLDGPAVDGAHFNLKERRNAASVHLGYPIPPDLSVAAFYNEVTAREEPLYTYYMACGWHRGYFGMQVNGPTERRIIFSVWDSGNEAVDRSKVRPEDRVQLQGKGEGVVADSFGNEGTGGHSHLVYPWKKGQSYRFVVLAEPDGTFTTYSGWFFFPERRAWGLIARFRAPRDGSYLRGLYSFSENFGGANGELLRRVEFGNQWVRRADGPWIELTRARFTCDATGRAGDRIDYAAGVAPGGRFFLQNGGFLDNGVRYGDTFNRPATGRQPFLPPTAG